MWDDNRRHLHVFLCSLCCSLHAKCLVVTRFSLILFKNDFCWCVSWAKLTETHVQLVTSHTHTNCLAQILPKKKCDTEKVCFVRTAVLKLASVHTLSCHIFCSNFIFPLFAQILWFMTQRLIRINAVHFVHCCHFIDGCCHTLLS